MDRLTGRPFFASEATASVTFGACISLAGVVGTPLGGALVDGWGRGATGPRKRELALQVRGTPTALQPAKHTDGSGRCSS